MKEKFIQARHADGRIETESSQNRFNAARGQFEKIISGIELNNPEKIRREADAGNSQKPGKK